jgi:hypothetical protein
MNRCIQKFLVVQRGKSRIREGGLMRVSTDIGHKGAHGANRTDATPQLFLYPQGNERRPNPAKIVGARSDIRLRDSAGFQSQLDALVGNIEQDLLICLGKALVIVRG